MSEKPHFIKEAIRRGNTDLLKRAARRGGQTRAQQLLERAAAREEEMQEISAIFDAEREHQHTQQTLADEIEYWQDFLQHNYHLSPAGDESQPEISEEDILERIEALRSALTEELENEL